MFNNAQYSLSSLAARCSDLLHDNFVQFVRQTVVAAEGKNSADRNKAKGLEQIQIKDANVLDRAEG